MPFGRSRPNLPGLEPELFPRTFVMNPLGMRIRIPQGGTDSGTSPNHAGAQTNIGATFFELSSPFSMMFRARNRLLLHRYLHVYKSGVSRRRSVPLCLSGIISVRGVYRCPRNDMNIVRMFRRKGLVLHTCRKRTLSGANSGYFAKFAESFSNVSIKAHRNSTKTQQNRTRIMRRVILPTWIFRKFHCFITRLAQEIIEFPVNRLISLFSKGLATNGSTSSLL
jgi:hypothetical protein